MIGDVEVRDTGRSTGMGVFARRVFDEGEFIFRRRHTKVVSGEEVADLDEWDRIHLCELGFERFAVLAPPGCYLNHSCDPNAMRHGVVVFAWRPIEAREEITIDYGSTRSTVTAGRATAVLLHAPGWWSAASLPCPPNDRSCCCRTRQRSSGASTGVGAPGRPTMWWMNGGPDLAKLPCDHQRRRPAAMSACLSSSGGS